jgi:uncharacterized SAM-binding protein YcdF (DUF218 family)
MPKKIPPAGRQRVEAEWIETPVYNECNYNQKRAKQSRTPGYKVAFLPLPHYRRSRLQLQIASTDTLKRMARAYRIAKNGLALIGMCWMLVMFTPLTRWYATKLAGASAEPKGDVLIVLGADQPTGDFIGLATYWRCVYAVRIWREGGFRTMVVSGGGGIAESMRKFIQFEGVPGDRIVVENRSGSTRENALFTAEILARLPGRKVLVTSDMHTYRSVRAFHKAGIEVAPRSFPYGLKIYNSWPARWMIFVELGIETAKIVTYRARGWI